MVAALEGAGDLSSGLPTCGQAMQLESPALARTPPSRRPY